MKILIINFEYPPLGGGGGVATKQLAGMLAQRHEVHVLTTWYPGLAKEETEYNLRVHRVRVWGRRSLPTASLRSLISFVPVAFGRGWNLCRRVKFDVINAQFVVPSGLPAALLSWCWGVPFVLSFIGGDLFDPTKGVSPHRHCWLRCLVRLVARQAKVCTAISEDTRRRAQVMHGVQQPIVVVPLGLVPSQEVKRRERSELGLKESGPLYVSIGRLIPRKGYEVLLEAWRKISEAHLAIIGSGPEKEKLVDIIRRYGLQDRVHLMGYLAEEKKQQVLGVADGYVSASWHEGFGLVFLEAMEAGLPIVATDQGGQRDLLTNGENAILVPVGNANQLREAVRQLLDNDEMRKRLGENNRRLVKEFYLEKTARSFEKVLIDAAGKLK